MTDPTLNQLQAEANGFHTRLAHDAHRAACLITWGRMSFTDAAEELRGLALVYTATRHYRDYDAVASADHMLMAELERHQEAHTESVEQMKEAAKSALAGGGGLREAKRAAVLCAASRELPVPIHLFTSALDSASVEHRRNEAWWKKRAVSPT